VVTDDVTFAIDQRSVGRFDGDTLVATGAGRGTVVATLDDRSGSAVVEVFRADVRIVDGAPGNASDLFDGAADDPARAPTIVYPSNGAIVPPNLGDFDVHWRDGSGSDLYELRLQTYYTDVRVYVATTALAGAWLAFLEREWSAVARSEVGATIAVTVRGLTVAAPGTAGRAAILVHNSREDVVGGIYYWAAANDAGVDGIFRHDMSRPGLPAEQFYTRTEAGRCVACHALSPDGTKMAVTYDSGNGPSNIVDVASRAVTIAENAWNFASFNPQGDRLLVARGGALALRDPATGTVLTGVPTGGYATHPDFAPTGDRIVYVRPGTVTNDWTFTGGSIATLTYQRAGDAFGGEVVLVSSGGENNYYPALSPDGQWVLFNRSAENAYDNGTAELWVAKVDGSVPPLRLSAANIGPGLTNSWARWAPFEGTYGESAEPLLWLTFSSKRDFGVRLVSANRPQIWMTPFFRGRAAQGLDPTAPAFRLPFQDLESSNHIAQWTHEIVPVE
jgi:hypothetical protein